jgi:hypothetical protein
MVERAGWLLIEGEEALSHSWGRFQILGSAWLAFLRLLAACELACGRSIEGSATHRIGWSLLRTSDESSMTRTLLGRIPQSVVPLIGSSSGGRASSILRGCR